MIVHAWIGHALRKTGISITDRHRWKASETVTALPRLTLGYSGIWHQRIEMRQPVFNLAVLMQKRRINNRWATDVWEVVAVLHDSEPSTEAERVAQADGVERWMFRGLPLSLRREEAEGYYLNISTLEPRVFVMWQLHNDLGVPQRITASYNDACTWMDAGEQVDSVAMPPDVYDAISAFTRDHYRPEPRKRIRPRSFQSKDHGPRSRG